MRWITQQGIPLVTASDSLQYDQEDLALFSFNLSNAEMEAIDRYEPPQSYCKYPSAKSCASCCSSPISYCVEQKCWLCQKDRTSAHCSSCWTTACMPKCEACYNTLQS